MIQTLRKSNVLSLSFDVHKLQADSCYLAESKKVRYRRPIVSTSPFKGKLEVINSFVMKKTETLVLDIAYQFEGRKATGESRLAIILKDLKD